MKKIIVVTAAIAMLGAAPALAADLPMKAKPMMPAPVILWNGWYVGINGGYAGGNNTGTESVVSGTAFPIIGAGTPLYNSPNHFRDPTEGALGGAQVGYNWQTATNFVLGVEADIQGADIKGSVGCILACNTNTTTIPRFAGFPVVFSNDSYSQKLDWFGTVRGRVGYANGPTMVYLTGGLAYGDVERTGAVNGVTLNLRGIRNSFIGSYDHSDVRVGWTAGVGAEGKLFNDPHWSVKGEYLYVDLGNSTDTFSTTFQPAPGGNPGAGQAAVRTDSMATRDHIFRLGVNYSFNPAVVAKY
jgi:outer membrane immunogenic protein